ncbi:hypothetical protein DL764_002183 [Monosporascus ibericus]|uniref:J domain-containing protein n=1 Tax=Monosporascus ibericus TaxID=155417 RepID=A0A4Q4TLH0_9PEZI|nr:hypothetical protein DL764_002183 [Monosporascus ibericus]
MDAGQEIFDYYALLCIDNPDSADQASIKKSYRQLALLRHPDKNLNDPEATARFQLLKKAYETLSHPPKRRLYDAKRKSTRPEAEGTGTHDRAWWNFWWRRRTTPDARAFATGQDRMPHETRPQRAEDRNRAAADWANRETQKHPERVRESMRERQREANEKKAKETEEATRRKELEEKRAWENQQERVRRNMEKGAAGVACGSRRQRIFRNLPGSNCEHRRQWDMVRQPMGCQACCRPMPYFVYRCPDCSMVACRKCMNALKRGKGH